MLNKKKFHIYLIKPTHYDDNGYPIRWFRSLIPSNSLAAVYGIAKDALNRQILGPNVECVLHTIDDTNTKINTKKILKLIQQPKSSGVICFVGVQTNQFPRTVDLARPFLEAGIPVAAGGFHISGCLSMLDQLPEDILAAQKMGISLFSGEAEDQRFDQVIKDAYAGALKKLYDYTDDMPSLEEQALPYLPKEQIDKTMNQYSSFDLGRGCPFECSFCTIINVQGRVSRFRTENDLENIIRANAENGIFKYFITDDNLARNKNWRLFFDRMIKLRQEDGIRLRLQIQVDTLCHRIDGFIEKAVAAGVDHIFIGMESINPDSLLLVKKRQNKIAEYREMLQAWKQYPIIITVGYILGFPNETRESILRDIDTVKRELPIDVMYFTNLTPLPGSEDHKKNIEAGVWMDSDMNLYDLNHRVIHYENIPDEEWDSLYNEVWNRYYTFKHMETVLKRAAALGSNLKINTVVQLVMYREYRRLYGIHPLEGGWIRLKNRKDRRPSLAQEPILVFYPKVLIEFFYTSTVILSCYFRVNRMMKKIWSNPKRFEYKDIAITPDSDKDIGELEILASDAAKKQKARAMRRKHIDLVNET